MAVPAQQRIARAAHGARAATYPAQLRASETAWFVGVVAAALLAALAFALLGVRVQRTLHASAYDLGFFDQVIWNTAHGRWFATSYTPHSFNFLGQHAEWALLPFAAIYRLFDAGPETLIEAQAVAAALAVVPLNLAARRHAPALPSALLCLAFLLAPQLERGVDFGFHPEMAVPLLAFSAYAAHLYNRPALFAAIGLAILLVKEDAALVVLALAALAAIDGRRRLGGALAAAAIVYVALMLLVVMPHVRGGYTSDLAERYAYLGTTPAAIVKGALLHPDRVIAHLSKWSIAATVAGLLLVTGLLPLFAPEALLLTAPSMLVGLLTTHPQQQALDVQYAAPVLAILFIAAARGSGRLYAANLHIALPRFPPAKRDSPTMRPPAAAMPLTLAGCAVIFAAVGFLLRGPYPGGGAYAAWRYRDDGDGAALTRIARLIPADAAVSAQTGLLAHLSQRRTAWEFPRLEGAPYVVVEDAGIVSQQSKQTYGGYDAVRAALPSIGYVEIARDHGIHLYRLADMRP